MVNDTEIMQQSVKSVRFGHQQHKMEGICSRRTIVETDRNRVIWLSVSFLPDAGVCFREECIMALKDTSASGSACLLRNWYRVFAEPFASADSEPQIIPECEQLQESVLRSHCRATGEFFHAVEKSLSNEVYDPCG